MAIYNEILSARFSRALQKMFSMKGPQAVKQVSGELLSIHSFFSGAENRFLESWNRYAASSQTGAVAANTSVARLRNPIGSGVVAVVEKVNISCATAVEFLLQMGGPNTADLGSIFAVTNNRLDPRQKGLNPSLIVSNQNSSPAVPGLVNNFNWSRAFLLASTPWECILTDIQEFPLAPGDAIQIFPTTVNLTIDWTFVWRERELEESEKAF